MPTLPFFELRAAGVERHRQVADASEVTRYRRIASTQAPFLSSLPKLGWKSPSLNTEMRITRAVFGFFRQQNPNLS